MVVMDIVILVHHLVQHATIPTAKFYVKPVQIHRITFPPDVFKLVHQITTLKQINAIYVHRNVLNVPSSKQIAHYAKILTILSLPVYHKYVHHYSINLWMVVVKIVILYV